MKDVPEISFEAVDDEFWYCSGLVSEDEEQKVFTLEVISCTFVLSFSGKSSTGCNDPGFRFDDAIFNQ